MRLEHGAEYDEQQGEERDEDKRNVVAFVNRVNTLALQLTQLPDFRERRKGCSGTCCCWMRVRERPFSTGVVCSFIYSQVVCYNPVFFSPFRVNSGVYNIFGIRVLLCQSPTQ